MFKFFNLIEVGLIDENTLSCSQFREVRFLKDFGPIKEGERHFCVSFDFTEMECSIFNEANNKTHRFSFKLKA